jgi:hexosaminidase
LQITASQATLTAMSDVGAMHGMETFLQLVKLENGTCSVPAVAIDDAPRFPCAES